MSTIKTLTAMSKMLNQATDILSQYNKRKYEKNDLENLLSEVSDLSQQTPKVLDKQTREDIFDLYDNISSYLKYYEEGNPESLGFLSDKIDEINSSIQQMIDQYDEEFNSDVDSDFDNEGSEPIEASSDSESEASTGFESEDETGVDEEELSSEPISSDVEEASEEDPELKSGFVPFHNKEKAKKKNLLHAMQAESLFFDSERNHNSKTHQLAKSFLKSRRQSGAGVIESDDVSARTIITAENEALKKSLPEGEALPKTQEEIVTKLKWHKKPGSKKDWSREKIQRGDTEVNSQYQPYPNNIGNFVMSGVGRYGSEGSKRCPGILEVIDDLTEGSSRREMKLAGLFIEFSKKGKPITEEVLYEKGFRLYKDDKLRKQHIERINRIGTLFCIKEISRRKELIASNSELPFGVAIARTLKLLADGHLRMADVFDHDSPYGVFSGKEILSEKMLPTTLEKFHRLFKLYNRIYFEEETMFSQSSFSQFAKPAKAIIALPEQCHKDLLYGLGGEEDSSGDEYDLEHDLKLPTKYNL